MTLREAFQAVYDRNGALTPALVVEEARSGTDEVAARLRDALPWDADEILYQHQLAVAAKLIRKMHIQFRPTPRSGLRSARAFVSVPSPEGRAYHPADVVAADPLMARLALQDAERQWRDLKRKYGHMSEFVAMVQRDLESGELAA